MPVIDVFRDRAIFDQLTPVNHIVRLACSRVKFAEEGVDEYDLPHCKVSYWYNPDRIWDLHLSHHYPEKTYGLTKDPKFNLLIYFPNYISIYLINLFYAERKTVLIEDLAGGDGRLFLYLSRLGFTNFHLTENFSQLCEHLLKYMMRLGRVTYTLNQPHTEPAVLHMVGLPYLVPPRETWPESIELACFYNNTKLVEVTEEGCKVRMLSGSLLSMPNFVPLCRDVDQLMNVFCRKDKYEEFVAKIHERGIAV